MDWHMHIVSCKRLRIFLSVEEVAAAFGRQEANTLTLGRHAEAGRSNPKLKTQDWQHWGQEDSSAVTSEVYPASGRE
jgi:hypothetical protein